MSATDLFRQPLVAARDNDRHPAWLWFSITLVGLIVAMLIWSRFAILEQVTTGPGQVVPSGRLQIIQNLEGGIVSELKVREGQIVERGQPLVTIDPTRAESSYLEMEKRRRGLLASVARLRAEATGRAMVFPREIASDRELVANERATYAVRRQAVDQSVAALAASTRLLRRELAITEPMAARGLVPEVDALRLRRQLNETEMQMGERLNRYRADAGTELAKVEAELAQVSEVAAGRRDMFERTVMRAPVRGTVKNIQASTVGGVVQPGADIMEIVPLEDELLIEAKIKPSDVAFLRPGLKATVKLTAYDYLIYGSLPGTVETIGPDTVRESKLPNEEPFYRVLVRTDRAYIRHNGKLLPIIPGMTATVDVTTGRRTVFDFFLRPVLKVEEAFRER
ncbi:HlyD family type I secretion periplasmic adaptor subunit [Sphingoaurantiacus capsulatus]|uniref:Membrane fusion protein (MFP) family protein n=1 Tax=Sphingoaurantiacus capsulatus TaxID=1771310 RepID=A0ABV7XBI1_9SPHN